MGLDVKGDPFVVKTSLEVCIIYASFIDKVVVCITRPIIPDLRKR